MKAAIRNFLFALFFISLPAAAAFTEPADPSTIFKWDDKQMDVGYFYHYSWTDMAGKSAPNDYYLYMADETHMQYLQNSYTGKGSRAIDLVTNTVDPLNFRYSGEDIVNLLPDTDKSYRTYRGEYDYAKGKITYTGILIEKGMDKKVNDAVDLPKGINIFYNQLGSDIGLLYRMIPENGRPFTVNFIDTLRTVHEAVVRHEKDEMVGGILCHKYLIEGQGVIAKVANSGGALWMAADDTVHYMVQFRMNVRVNWDLANMGVKLAERKKMSPAEWKAFQDAMVAEQKKKGKF